jgi:predicted acyl esterase
MKFWCAIALLAGVFGIPNPGIREEEFIMPTRDGVGLHTIVFFPKMEEGKKYTAIVDRSPYGYGDMEWITDIFLPFGSCFCNYLLIVSPGDPPCLY